MHLLFSIFLILSAPLHAQEEVLKGFLYPLENDSWALSETPNLKSCCVSKHPYTLLRGKIDSNLSHQVVHVVGRFHEEDQTNVFLVDRITAEKRRPPWATLSLIFLLSLTFFFALGRRRSY